MALKDLLAKAFISDSTEEKKLNIPVTEMREWDDYASLTKSPDYLKQFFGWTYKASKTIADSVTSYPLELYKGIGEDVTRIEDDKDQMLKDLHRFNPYQNLNDARWLTRTHLDLAGLSFWYITDADGKDYKYEFYVLHPNRVTIKTNGFGVPDHYVFRDTIGQEHHIKEENMIVFREADPDNWLKGTGALSAARLPHNTWELMQEFNMNFFGNNATPEGILGFEGISDEQRKKIQTALKQTYGGTKNSGKMGVLNYIPTWIPLTNNQKDLQYTEGLENMRDDILSIFGVPKPLVGLTDSTYTNSIEAQRIYQRYTIEPKLRKEAEVLTDQLIRKYYMFNKGMAKDLLFIAPNPVEADSKAEAEEVEILYRSGIVTLNEARVKVGYEQIEDGNDVKRDYQEKPEQDDKPEDKKPEEKTVKSVQDKSQKYIREELRDYFYTKSLSQEETFSNVASRYFRSQSDRILEQLNLEEKAINYNPVIDWAAEDAIAIDMFLGIYEEIMKSAWTDADDLIGDTSQITPEVRELIKNRASYLASQMNKTTEKELSVILEEGVSEGMSSIDIAKNIKDTFDRWANGGEGIDVKRAEMIARTEVNTISNSTKMVNYKANGIEEKEWLSARDSATRAAHLEADGQTVGINNTFDVGGEALDRPGDPAGSAGNIINCRCVVMPVIK